MLFVKLNFFAMMLLQGGNEVGFDLRTMWSNMGLRLAVSSSCLPSCLLGLSAS